MTQRLYTCKDGIAARIDAFQITDTYAGQLLGEPNLEANRFLLDSFQERLRKCWGERPTMILWSSGAQQPHSAALPAWSCALWATSHYAPSPEDDLSELVVIWFEPSLGSQPIEDLAARALARVDWRPYARGCPY